MKEYVKTKTQLHIEALPYAYDALMPEFSEETLRCHHDKHQQAYIDKVNELIAGTPLEDASLEQLVLQSEGTLYNQAAQAWNHTFYFDQFTTAPTGPFEGIFHEAVLRDFGSFATLQERMNHACTTLFGSGWVWLVTDVEGRLSIYSTPNAGNPLRHGLQPLLTLDVWEHAYYIYYRNRRLDAVVAHWRRINWRRVADRYAQVVGQE
jgi:Fe-Mn family superoxide dismutase